MATITNQAYNLAPANGYTRIDPESLSSDELKRKKTDELKRKKRIKLAVDVVGIIFFMTVIGLTVLKVKSPKVRLGNINIENFISVPSTPSFDTKFTTQIFVDNTNWGPYKFDAGLVTFMYQGVAVGQVAIPENEVGMFDWKKADVEVSLSANALSGSNLGTELSNGVLTLNSQVKLTGKVKLILIMKKKRSAFMDCTIAFDISSKTLKSLRCK